VKSSDDEIELRCPREILATCGYKRGDIVALDTVRAKGEFEVLRIDAEGETLTVRPHHRSASSVREDAPAPNRHQRRAAAKLRLVR
jgi:hypothetical protein